MKERLYYPLFSKLSQFTSPVMMMNFVESVPTVEIFSLWVLKLLCWNHRNLNK